LARGALAGAREAMPWLPVERDVVGQRLEELLGRPQVALDDDVDAHLLRQREQLPHLAEQRPRRTGEVAAVGRHAPDRRLARLEQLVACRAGLDAVPRLYARSQLTVDGTTEVIHPNLSFVTPLKAPS